MKKVIFDLGYGVDVESFHCKKCGFNVTPDKKMKKALTSLRDQMKKEIKIIKIGDGLGVRFPNEIVKSYNIKKGGEITIKPVSDGIKLDI
ncbi:MAG: AbrB/MazE/SpoVT family DNA-binding domain-containing protein [Candidatus Woesearchaeota archaeon]|jgi:hypothetical protein|nr:AbrB/MazE/SpoVT family DNA-binding domain-containing protein [Candidatus Woesearchaeota archaeon]MDP7323510.1 AbrB/MazE/SpoVT family DNA-binding domain-containing protein [Candidatus Woesearchaeota archaeon]